MTATAIKSAIREIPDFPKPGITFKDITPLLANAELFRATVNMIADRITAHKSDEIVVVESRGFIIGAPVAFKLGLPLQLVRKSGRLPHETVGVVYQLEYGTDQVELHIDAITPGRRYALIDDLLATGGTAAATAELIESQHGQVSCCSFIIELTELRGAEKLSGYPIESIVRY